MKLLLFLLAVTAAFGAEWDAVRRMAPGEKIEITTRDGARTRAEFVSATEESVVMRVKEGERSMARTEIRQVGVYDAGRRVRRGLLWTVIGAGAGAGVGLAACPGCANEGNGAKFAGPGVAIGAAAGALGFLVSPYQTVYKSR